MRGSLDAAGASASNNTNELTNKQTNITAELGQGHRDTPSGEKTPLPACRSLGATAVRLMRLGVAAADGDDAALPAAAESPKRFSWCFFVSSTDGPSDTGSDRIDTTMRFIALCMFSFVVTIAGGGGGGGSSSACMTHTHISNTLRQRDCGSHRARETERERHTRNGRERK